MLLGSHAPKLDEKGRLILPAKFREEFSSGLYLTQGQERCIYVFSDRESKASGCCSIDSPRIRAISARISGLAFSMFSVMVKAYS